MNAVEIEEAVSELALQPFEAKEFPFSFLEAFGNKSTTIKKLRSGSSNKTDVEGAILQRNNIHIATCKNGKVAETLDALLQSPSTKKNKVEFIGKYRMRLKLKVAINFKMLIFGYFGETMPLFSVQTVPL